MAIDEVNTKLAKVALDNCEGFPFEEFAHDFFSSIIGTNFVPVGGVSDGGADGIHEQGLFSVEDKPSVFYQISIEKNHRPKIKKTIDRLVEFGRTPKRLIYITSQVIGTYDTEEDDLSDKHDVNIKIRDGKYILSHMNNSEATKKSYYTHLSKYTDFLKDLSNGKELKVSSNINNPSVYVFLQQQVENKEKDKHLTKSVADSLLLWALNDTDPDKDKFLTKTEILHLINSSIPWAKHIVGGMIDQRLKVLSDKFSPETKKVNYHRKGDKYCLPYETRLNIAQEKASDESLRIDVINEIVEFESLKSLEPDEKLIAANCSVRVTQMFFEKEGLNCASYLNGNGDQSVDSLIENTVYDRVVDAINETDLKGEQREKICNFVCEVVRNLFYQSTPSQRMLLNKFSRTYVLLFTLQAEPRVVEYFQKATANFKLLVGTDLIIRAMSERFLSKENQMTRNLFKMANEAGIKLYLSENAFDGVLKHIIVTDNEYRHHILPREAYITRELIRESPQILIRTYYHAKGEGYTKSWSQFISEFITYKQLHVYSGEEELKTYITQQFGMEFISTEDLTVGVSEQAIEDLTKEILKSKDNERLAKDVSIIINSIYGQRRMNKEHSTFPEFGYQTWWLTQESKVQRHTQSLVKKYGAKYIMRPEFLINFFALSPSVADIKESYKTIFPSVMGIQMGNRLPDELFHKVLGQVDVWKETEEGRVVAKTRALCDRLKAEHFDNDVNYNAVDNAIAEVNKG